MQKMNDAGLRLLKTYEGFSGKAYPDPGTGGEPWTIGYGHTSQAGPPQVKKGMSISRAEAEEILRADLASFEAGVARLVRVPLSDNQFSALVSFAYNIGLGAFAKSSVLQSVNGKRFNEVPRRLNLWVKAAGRTLPGLVKRRAAEGLLFQEPDATAPTARASLLSPTDGEISEGQDVAGQIEPEQGKSELKSTTVWSAIAAMALGAYQAGKDMLMDVYGAASSAGLGPKLLISFGIGAGIVGAGLYIIKERGGKSKNDGI